MARIVREHRIEFGQPAVGGDELTITTYIGEVGETSFRRWTLIASADGETVARAQTLWEWIDPAPGNPAPIPNDWLLDFAEQIADMP